MELKNRLKEKDAIEEIVEDFFEGRIARKFRRDSKEAKLDDGKKVEEVYLLDFASFNDLKNYFSKIELDYDGFQRIASKLDKPLAIRFYDKDERGEIKQQLKFTGKEIYIKVSD